MGSPTSPLLSTGTVATPIPSNTTEKTPSLAIRIAAVLLVVFARVAVGRQPHSGQNNFHGSRVAYGGDFEAQRHWMEITINLPIKDWYFYDLQYWGLDYPPLSAYQSWLCGKFSQLLVGSQSVALDTSRGYEDPIHKAFMRATVILFDLVFYASAAWFLTRPDTWKGHHHSETSLFLFLRVMLQPSILLIDHGHFQYNTAALGLSLWSFFFFTKQSGAEGMKWPILGSVFFCCALSFKQMTLYYAPAVFAYLLGRCFQQGNTTRTIVYRFLSLAMTVVLTFAATWWPFIVFGPPDTTAVGRLLHVLRRIFPFQRGLFEGKVANIWCALSIQPFRIRQRIPEDLQPVAALLVTLTMILPACIKLYWIGRQRNTNEHNEDMSQKHRRYLLWGATNTALAFFLASFQVHEKSLLMSVAPASLLAMESPGFSDWFAFVATWTMWPLLVLDRLQVAYYCTMLLFGVFICLIQEFMKESPMSPRIVDTGILTQHWMLRIMIPSLTAVLALALHSAEAFVAPPNSMPDLFPVLWSIAGCGMCLIAWLVTLCEMFRPWSTRKEKEE